MKKKIGIVIGTLLLFCNTLAAEGINDEARELVIHGIKFYKVDKFEEAQAAFDSAIKLNPKYARAFAARGYFFGMIGRADQSLKDINTAIGLDPNDPTCWCELGIRYVNSSPKPLRQKAIEAFSKAIKLNPKFMMAYHYRGLSYEKIGNATAAQEDFEIEEKLVGNGNKKYTGCMPWFDNIAP